MLVDRRDYLLAAALDGVGGLVDPEVPTNLAGAALRSSSPTACARGWDRSR